MVNLIDLFGTAKLYVEQIKATDLRNKHITNILQLALCLRLPKLTTSKTFNDLSLATEQNRSPSTLAAVQHIDPR